MAFLSRRVQGNIAYRLLSVLCDKTSCCQKSAPACHTGSHRVKKIHLKVSSRLSNIAGHNCSKSQSSSFQCNFCTIASDKSTATVDLNFNTVINPQLNIEMLFSDLNRLEENVRRRRLNLDIKQLHSNYCQLVQLEMEKLSLEQQRRENADLMKDFVKGKNELLEAEKAELIRRGKLIKAKLKQMQDSRYNDLYKQVVSFILNLPVDLHPSTLEEDTIVAEYGCKPEFSFPALSHLTLGQNMKFLDFRQNIGGNTYYLLNDAALLEHHLLNRVISSRLRSSDLQHIVCPDMVKAFVVEGCGFSLSEMFELMNKTSDPSQLERSGQVEDLGKSGNHDLVLSGVSCMGFAAYLSAMNIHSRSLPLKYYSIGRSYTPVVVGENKVGLYSASQANSAALFGAVASPMGAEQLLDEFSSITLSLYKNLNLHCRMVQVGAKNLRPMESKRTDFYVWSASFNRYFKSGELRLCNDYISRRLSIRSVDDNFKDDGTDNSQNNFVHTVDGCIVKIPTVIAALMEHFQNKDGTCLLPTFT